MKKLLLILSLSLVSINAYCFNIFDILSPGHDDCKVIHTGVFCQVQITSLIFQEEHDGKMFGLYSGIKTENCFKHVTNHTLVKAKPNNYILIDYFKNDDVLRINQDLGHLIIASLTPLNPAIPVTVIEGEIKQCGGGTEYHLSGMAVNYTTIKYLRTK